MVRLATLLLLLACCAASLYAQNVDDVVAELPENMRTSVEKALTAGRNAGEKVEVTSTTTNGKTVITIKSSSVDIRIEKAPNSLMVSVLHTSSTRNSTVKPPSPPVVPKETPREESAQ